MKSVYINQLRDGEDLHQEPFLLHDVVRRVTKDGRPFLLCTFGDRTGQANGVFWDVPDDVDGWVRAGIVTMVDGRVGSYKDSLQINVADLVRYENPNMSYFLRSSSRPQEEMIAELKKYIASLNEPWQKLVSDILLAPAFLTKFANAPAARLMHHAYIGGLLEHTLNMAALGDMIAAHYPYVNRDLLMAGILLHDMGKCLEYTTEASFSFTDDGRLVGHIARAAIMVEKAAAQIEISTEQLRQLVHLIVAHHGKLEWGSPVQPKTLEAIILHQIDLLDSRVQGFFDHLQNDAGDELWTSKSSYMFNTELRRPAQMK